MKGLAAVASNAVSFQDRISNGRWRPGLDGKRIDLRISPENPHYLDHAATLLDPARELEWVVAFHPKKQLVLGYIFRRKHVSFGLG
jgi:hypothetical protein